MSTYLRDPAQVGLASTIVLGVVETWVMVMEGFPVLLNGLDQD
jgi:hypothetical protein